jgi:hypothetical protein
LIFFFFPLVSENCELCIWNVGYTCPLCVIQHHVLLRRRSDSPSVLWLVYGLGSRGNVFGFPARTRDFSLFESSRLTLRSTHSPMRWVPGNLSLGIKWLEFESGTSSVLTLVSVLFEHCAKTTFSFVISLCPSVCLSVRMRELGLPCRKVYEISCLRIFRKSVEKVKMH